MRASGHQDRTIEPVGDVIAPGRTGSSLPDAVRDRDDPAAPETARPSAPLAPLRGVRVAILSADGVEQVELTRPRDALAEAGAAVTLISLHPGEIQAMNHLTPGDRFLVDGTVDQARTEDFDALLLPGGVSNPDALRQDPEAVAFVRAMFESGRPIGVICHGPWTLIEAGVVGGLKITSWPSLRTDITNAGGVWVDQEVVCDRGIVSSRKPADLPAFCAAIVEQFAAGAGGRREAVAATAGAR
jgi:protease I